MRAALITISSSKAAGVGHDESGERLALLAARIGVEIAGRELIADDRELIEQRLRHWSENGDCDLVLTSGGTGVAPSDVTPEATLAVIEREVPGIAEALRQSSRAHTKHWMLSRGVAGIRGETLIVNLPGSPKAVTEAGDAIADALAHALELIAGSPTDHGGAPY
jgi:molybdenum cofactor synthesis domain-containing protein